MVTQKLEPLQKHLQLLVTNVELKKIVLTLPSVVGCNHTSLIEKLWSQQECMGMAVEEFGDAVIVQLRVFI
jgi:hypothetical protein